MLSVTIIKKKRRQDVGQRQCEHTAVEHMSESVQANAESAQERELSITIEPSHSDEHIGKSPGVQYIGQRLEQS